MSSVLPFNVLRYVSLPSTAADFVSPYLRKSCRWVSTESDYWIILFFCARYCLNKFSKYLVTHCLPIIILQIHGKWKTVLLSLWHSDFGLLLSSLCPFLYFLLLFSSCICDYFPSRRLRYGNGDTSNVLTSDRFRRVQCVLCWCPKALAHLEDSKDPISFPVRWTQMRRTYIFFYIFSHWWLNLWSCKYTW